MSRVIQSATARRERSSHNLPEALTSFVGRKRELAEVKRLLTRGESRLLTLTGPGGCGKTRLALRVASELVSQFANGVWRIELAALMDPALLPQAVATALGVREQPNHPLLNLLLDYLRPRQTLLVFDNCEHLLDSCRALVDTLLPACPRLTILATSRERLGAASETLRLVSPLGLLPVDKTPLMRSSLTEYDALRLFVERERDIDRRFALTDDNAPHIARVCRRKVGIPLLRCVRLVVILDASE